MDENTITNMLKKCDRSILVVICRKLGLTKTTQKTNRELKSWIFSTIQSKTNKNDSIELLKKCIPSTRNVQRAGKQAKSKKRGRLQNTTSREKYSMNSRTCFYPPVERLIAIGDLHGDLQATILSLQKASVISQDISIHEKNIKNIHWTGGKTYVCQLGDQVDRVRPSQLYQNLCRPDDPELIEDEGNDLKIMCLFDQLDQEAKQVGGRCISILGNHELMNVDGDFRYVSPKEFCEFGNYFRATRSMKNSNIPYGYHERKNAFCPGGVLSRRMAAYRYAVVQIGSWLFVHGSLHPKVAKEYSLTKLNNCISKWLLNIDKEATNSDINFLYHNEDDSVSPFWSRIYSDHDEFDESKKKMFYETIDNVNRVNKQEQFVPAKGMILGHSPQFMYNKPLNSDLNKCIWRVDVGVSRAFGKRDGIPNRKIQLLEILNDKIFNVLS